MKMVLAAASCILCAALGFSQAMPRELPVQTANKLIFSSTWVELASALASPGRPVAVLQKTKAKTDGRLDFDAVYGFDDKGRLSYFKGQFETLRYEYSAGALVIRSSGGGLRRYSLDPSGMPLSCEFRQPDALVPGKTKLLMRASWSASEDSAIVLSDSIVEPEPMKLWDTIYRLDSGGRITEVQEKWQGATMVVESYERRADGSVALVMNKALSEELRVLPEAGQGELRAELWKQGKLVETITWSVVAESALP